MQRAGSWRKGGGWDHGGDSDERDHWESSETEWDRGGNWGDRGCGWIAGVGQQAGLWRDLGGTGME